MAQVVLGGIGGALGGGVGRFIGATLGRAVDNSLISALSPARQRGPRLEALKIQSSAEGAPMACVFGRARVTGQVIWAARFMEQKNKSGGGKSGPKTVEYAYSLSFAVALCEGPIDGVGRVWADGQPLDLSGVTMRVHRGGPDQTPDDLIAAVEGTAPAYRGVAYVVFEDLPLSPFGNRAPQLSFEVFRRPQSEGMEEMLEGVCLIPGAGEFVLATEPVLRRTGLATTATENMNNGEGRPDLLVSLDQLQAQCPNLKRVSLIVGWFGDDLRAGHCRVRPGVERRDKRTEPLDWSVAGLGRADAYLISQTEDGGPAYGGTPSDETVRQAVRELKARGLEVTLYPFVFMDVARDNDLPDPYGGARQAPYPWRGRITAADGMGAAGEVAGLFGETDGWGLRRLALHYARIAGEEGADGLLIGSEMRGLTRVRDHVGGYPAVEQFRALAAECRAVAGAGVKLSYAADWSEYFGHQADGGVVFHLDPLWADPNIAYVGIDWYAPLGDWRAGDGGLDAQGGWSGPDDPAYMAANVAGGDGFDWYYASDADRAAQRRTPIVDEGHGEHWIYRYKDLKGWWSNLHHDRPGGVRQAEPTAWRPGMKPIRLTEFGCPAVDRGGNSPNLFLDPKSAESALPPHSTGARDDRMQRRAIEAVLQHFRQAGANPVSDVYGGPMMEGADVWCWDARPYPAFPARGDLWADVGAWRAGHWLNGRMQGEAGDLLAAVLRRGGLSDGDFSIEGVEGLVAGYVIDRPMRTRDAVEPLLGLLDAVASERGGKVAILGRGQAALAVERDDLALPDEGAEMRAERRLEERPATARVRFIDEGADYQTGSVVVRPEDARAGGAIDFDAPAVCSAAMARAAAVRALDAGGPEDRLTLAAGPLLALKAEPGDAVVMEGRSGRWRVSRVALDETPTLELERDGQGGVVAGEDEEWRPTEPPVVVAAPFVRILDLPPLLGREDDGRLLAAVAGDPWRAMQVHMGPSVQALTPRGVAERPATVGRLVEDLRPGVMHRWDEANSLLVEMEGAEPSSADDQAVLAGANLLAVETAKGWEIVQFARAELVGGGMWRLSRLLRGQQGSEAAMEAGAVAGSVVVVLDDRLAVLEAPGLERGAQMVWRVGPLGGPAGGSGVAGGVFTYEAAALRPWRPARLTAAAGAGGALNIGWIARQRRGDPWGGDSETASGPFRLRILDSEGATVREVETAGAAFSYEAAQIAVDFPLGIEAGACVTVAEWGAGYGWGEESRVLISSVE